MRIVLLAQIIASSVLGMFLDEAGISPYLYQIYSNSSSHQTNLEAVLLRLNNSTDVATTTSLIGTVFDHISDPSTKVITVNSLAALIHKIIFRKDMSDRVLAISQERAQLKISEISHNSTYNTVSKPDFTLYMTSMMTQSVLVYPDICRGVEDLLKQCRGKRLFENGLDRVKYGVKRLLEINPRVRMIQRNCLSGLDAFNGYRIEGCVIGKRSVNNVTAADCLEMFQCFLTDSERNTTTTAGRNKVYDLADSVLLSQLITRFYYGRSWREFFKMTGMAEVGNISSMIVGMLICPLCSTFFTISEFIAINIFTTVTSALTATPWRQTHYEAYTMNAESSDYFT